MSPPALAEQVRNLADLIRRIADHVFEQHFVHFQISKVGGIDERHPATRLS